MLITDLQAVCNLQIEIATPNDSDPNFTSICCLVQYSDLFANESIVDVVFDVNCLESCIKIY
jgi:hypothetical protein